MIASEFRAQAWKYGCAVLAVLALAALMAALYYRGASASANARAVLAEGLAKSLANSIKRDDASANATAQARTAAEQRSVERESREQRAERIAHEPRPPVPSNCPGPDAQLSAELQDGAARVRSAQDRLRGYGRAAGQSPR
ncbi:hypothetical protein [Lysobacter enzymogenes]|uniref:hypothetical protein n=1 Tax=Lysobacter enzymogenes TaxID=69 RepID=UPI001A96020C|nr:hypothetical protein [Lysobacter enzymogenes]QQP96536.1 hypothetical protein JHW38_00310 [Lysobacter enzymogenes]